MFLTMAVLAIPLMLITWFFQSAGSDEPVVPEVDWQSAVADAKASKAFDVREPAALPAGWRATKARWMEPGQPGTNGDPVPGHTLELGFLSDDQMHFALNQTLSPSGPYVTRVSREGYENGTVEVNGTTWKHYISPDERTHSLVLLDGKVTRMVVSDAGVERLKEFAGLLK